MKMFLFTKKNFIIVSVFTFLMLLLFGYLLLLHYYVDIPIDKNEFENIFSNIEDGFIICTLGNNLWSDYFARLSTNDKRFSHLGIIRVCDGNISVVHSAGTIKLGNDFVKEDSFNIYIANVRAIGIYKINSIESYKIGQEAINLIGVPFDWQFDMLDDSKLYCTELLYVILKSIDPSIELQTIFNNEFNCDIIPLEAISNSDYFEEIFYIDNLLEEVKK